MQPKNFTTRLLGSVEGGASLLLLLLCSTCLYASPTVVEETLALGLPVLDVETADGTFPTFDPVSAPAGCWGSSITNATKVPGRIVMYSPSGAVCYDSGEYAAGESGMTIRVRGNTTAYWAKRPFKIKLQKKADLLRRNDRRYEDKDWLLIRDMGINTYEGFLVGRLLDMAYTPAGEYVNVVFNGEYYGLYLLCESVKRKKDCRIVTDAATGFVMEIDAYWWNEEEYIESSFSEPMEWTFKYPEPDEVTPEEKDYIAGCLSRVEASLADGTYPSLIDVETFAKWLLGHEILANPDGGGANAWVSKHDDSEASLLTMPVLWDFGNIRKAGGWSGPHNIHFFRHFFRYDESCVFKKAFVDCWQRLGDSVFDGLEQGIRAFASSDLGKAYDRSFVVDYEKWRRYFPLDSLHVDEMAERDIAYYRQRREWLDNAISELGYGLPVRIDTIDSTPLPAVFTLTGIAVPQGTEKKGVYIVGGKKRILP